MFKQLVLMVLLSMGVSASELHLEKNYIDALKKADATKKPVMFIVSRHTCKYCIILEKEVLSNKDVIKELNANFVNVIAYTDDKTWFPQSYNLGATPTIWFLSHNGKPLFKPVRGALELADFKAALPQVEKEYKLVNKKKHKKKESKVQ